MTITETIAKIEALDIVSSVNVWKGKRAYINLTAKSNRHAGDRSHQFYLDMETGEIVDRAGKGITSREFDAQRAEVVEAISAADEADETSQDVEATDSDDDGIEAAVETVIASFEGSRANVVAQFGEDEADVVMGQIASAARRHAHDMVQSINDRGDASPYAGIDADCIEHEIRIAASIAAKAAVNERAAPVS